MGIITIDGGQSIEGTITIKGAKNSAVAIIPACLLFNGEMKIKNTPDILDIKWCGDILLDLGIDYDYDGDTFSLRAEKVEPYINSSSVRQYRGSYYFMGTLLGRYGKVSINRPGGCNIGSRPIDYHLQGFSALGAEISYQDNLIIIESNKLVGTTIELPRKSVGATINIMLAAVYAQGTTRIVNASVEPEVDDVIEFLNESGCNIKRNGNEVIIIGRERVIDTVITHTLIPDRIACLTYLVIGLLCGKIVIKNANYRHMQAPLYLLIRANANIEIHDDWISACCSEIGYLNVVTQEYPGMPTDIVQMLSILMAANNGGAITENIFDNRFKSLEELRKMKADIEIEGNQAIVNKSALSGSFVQGNDLRGAASLVVAGLVAKGKTVVDAQHYIERGYAEFINNLRSMGALIRCDE